VLEFLKRELWTRVYQRSFPNMVSQRLIRSTSDWRAAKRDSYWRVPERISTGGDWGILVQTQKVSVTENGVVGVVGRLFSASRPMTCQKACQVSRTFRRSPNFSLAVVRLESKL